MSHAPSRLKRGPRRIRALIGAVFAVAALGAVGASSAHAFVPPPTTITFNHGFLDLGSFKNNEVVKPDAPVTVDTTIDPTTGDFSVPAGGLTLDYTFSGVTLHIELADTLNGNYNTTTGELTTQTAHLEGSVMYGTATCSWDATNAIPFALSTETQTPFLGDRFDSGSNPPLNGAVVTNWPDLPDSHPAAPADAGTCALLDGIANGPGGLWLSNGIATPTRPAPIGGDNGGSTSGTTTPAPQQTVAGAVKKKKCKKAKKGSASAAKKCKKK